MKIVRTSLMLLFCAVVTLLLYSCSFASSQQQQHRNERRQIDLVSYAKLAQTSAVTHNSIPGWVTVNPHQIGTAVTDCAIQTARCTVLAADCVDPNAFEATPSGFLSADITIGNSERTGYVVRLEPPNTVVVTACYSESTIPLETRLSLPINTTKLKGITHAP